MFCTGCGKDIIGTHRCFYCGAKVNGENIKNEFEPTAERRERKIKKHNSVEIDEREALAYKRKGLAKILIAIGAVCAMSFCMIFWVIGIVILKRARTLNAIVKDTETCFGKTHATQFKKEVLKLIKEKKFEELNDLLSLNHDEMQKAHSNENAQAV